MPLREGLKRLRPKALMLYDDTSPLIGVFAQFMRTAMKRYAEHLSEYAALMHARNPERSRRLLDRAALVYARAVYEGPASEQLWVIQEKLA